MIIELFASLPPYISVEGVNFYLQIVNNGTDDVRLCYILHYADADSRHYQSVSEYGCWGNPFHENKNQGFLFLVENIKTDDDLVSAILDAHIFLAEKKLL